jgi:hypothetical protein
MKVKSGVIGAIAAMPTALTNADGIYRFSMFSFTVE